MTQNRRMPVAAIIAIGILVTFLSISSFQNIPAQSQEIQPPTLVGSDDLGSSFKQLGVNGSILIYDRNNKKFYEHNPSHNSQAFFPASTFKIFNSLVALETGIIPNDVAILTRDGVQRTLSNNGSDKSSVKKTESAIEILPKPFRIVSFTIKGSDQPNQELKEGITATLAWRVEGEDI